MTDPIRLKGQHAHEQTQDEDALGEVVRLLISSAEGFEKAASVARADAYTEQWRREAEDRWALSRKWAIPLLEHLDSMGVTRRVGDERLLAAPR